jgi:hypothetical protein
MQPRKMLDWRKALIYTHRWAGIALTAVFVVWFVSGVIFVYVGMPTLPAEERLLRMEPLDLTNVAVTPADAASRAGLQAPSRVRIAMSGGRPVYRFQSGGTLNIDRQYVMVSALHPGRGAFTSFGKDRMWDVARSAMPGIPIADAAWLNSYDAYYYSHTGLKSLPVLRIRYADQRRTWLYLDPQRGVIASRLERSSRWNRWLYHGFHSLDFPFLYYKRRLWDIIVILLSVGGIAISVTSAWPAWRRILRHVRPWPVRGERPTRQIKAEPSAGPATYP